MLGSAIVAASKTVPDQRVTSAYMIFSKAASFDAPLDLAVDVLRGGRSFSTVEVRINQDDKLRSAGLLMLGADVPDTIHGAVAMPDVPGPEDAVPLDMRVTGRDLRVVDGAWTPIPIASGRPSSSCGAASGRGRAAVPPRGVAGAVDHALEHRCRHAPARGLRRGQHARDAVDRDHVDRDHAFHDEVDVTEWLLYSNPAIYAGRGLVQGEGHVFTATADSWPATRCRR